MTEAHDENSINTDVTFESGDENVGIRNSLKFSENSSLPMNVINSFANFRTMS